MAKQRYSKSLAADISRYTAVFVMFPLERVKMSHAGCHMQASQPITGARRSVNTRAILLQR